MIKEHLAIFLEMVSNYEVALYAEQTWETDGYVSDEFTKEEFESGLKAELERVIKELK